MIDRDGVVHYAPDIPPFLRSPVRALLAGRRATRSPSTTTRTWPRSRSSRTAPRRVCDNFLLVTLGTGVGGGIVSEGKLLRGAHGFAAEIGDFQVDPNGPICACGSAATGRRWHPGTRWCAGPRARRCRRGAITARANGNVGGVITGAAGRRRGGGRRCPTWSVIGARRRGAGSRRVVGLAIILDPAGCRARRPRRARRRAPRSAAGGFAGHLEGARLPADRSKSRRRPGERGRAGGAAVLARHPRPRGRREPALGHPPVVPQRDRIRVLAVVTVAEAAGLDAGAPYIHLFRRGRRWTRRLASRCSP